MKDTITAIMKRHSIAHLLRAHTRFNRRLGNHFAASITYFTVLAIIRSLHLPLRCWDWC
ncbi:hypothetical protein JCM18920_791 [Cutibacterium acnes JCM 18920]|nr:hypothetical protein JCM18920_791 [Cutibacterium acnes JCM 18920]